MHERAIDRAIRMNRGTYRRSIRPKRGVAWVYAYVGEGAIPGRSVIREVQGRGSTVGCVEIVVPNKDYVFGRPSATGGRHRLHVGLVHSVATAEDSHCRRACEIVRAKDIHAET